jgi:hypothetical protein
MTKIPLSRSLHQLLLLNGYFRLAQCHVRRHFLNIQRVIIFAVKLRLKFFVRVINNKNTLKNIQYSIMHIYIQKKCYLLESIYVFRVLMK